MSATILTIEAAQAANFEVVTDGRYNQAVHDTVVALQAGRRSGSANTKTKGEVAYSGAKPWRQKGTGRARAGSKGSPVWRGGGVVFGPKPRDYSKKVNKKVKRVALRKALSERIQSGDVLHVASFAIAEPKTKQFVDSVKSITPEHKIMIVARDFDATTYLAGRNVQNVELVTTAAVNAEHVLKYRKIILAGDALVAIAERISKR